jgi:Leucine-rich repeat (LRR) protein
LYISGLERLDMSNNDLSALPFSLGKISFQGSHSNLG